MILRKYTAGFLMALTLSGLCLSNLQAGRIEVMDDFDFGTWSPLMSRWKKEVPVCVWDESVSQTNFTVVASGINSARRFRLKNDVNDKLNYKVHWRDGSGSASRERLNPNIDSSYTYRSTDSNRCQSGPTGFLEVTINRKALNEASPGVYSDTLIVMISAQ